MEFLALGIIGRVADGVIALFGAALAISPWLVKRVEDRRTRIWAGLALSAMATLGIFGDANQWNTLFQHLGKIEADFTSTDALLSQFRVESRTGFARNQSGIARVSARVTQLALKFPPQSFIPSVASSNPAPQSPLAGTAFLPILDQVRIVGRLLRETPRISSGVWLSDVVAAINSNKYSDAPITGSVNYSHAVALLANEHDLDVINARPLAYAKRGRADVLNADFEVRLHRAGEPRLVPMVPQNGSYTFTTVTSSRPGYYEYQFVFTPALAPIRPVRIDTELDAAVDTAHEPAAFYGIVGAPVMLGVSAVASWDGLRNNVISVTIFWPAVTPQNSFFVQVFSRAPLHLRRALITAA